MKQIMKIAEAMDGLTERISFRESAGRITAEYIYLYPPGIPLIVPGEQIPEGFPEEIAGYLAQGLDVQGLSDMNNETILIHREEK